VKIEYHGTNSTTQIISAQKIFMHFYGEKKKFTVFFG